MKILAIIASPRGMNGNTGRLLEEVLAGVRTFPDEETLFARARELGQTLCQAVSEQRRFPEQEQFQAAFRLRMSGLVDYMQEYWGFEREYWQQKRNRAGRQHV